MRICELLQADHSEKPSIINLITMLAEKMVKKYDTVAVSRMVREALCSCKMLPKIYLF